MKELYQKKKVKDLKKKKKLDRFFETSAKTGENARSALLEAAKLLYKEYLKAKQNIGDSGQTEDDNNQKGDKLIKKNDGKTKGKKGCC